MSRTLTLSLLVPLLAATAFATGCRTSSDHRPTTYAQPRPVKPASPARARAEAATEVATGQVRDALLQLQRIHFGLDTAVLLTEARDSLARAAELLKAHPDVEIYVDGHTDERGTDEYNVALGERRASAVIDYLVRMGIGASRLHPMTFGEERPLQSGTATEDLAANRRAEFRLYRGNVELVLEPGIAYDDAGQPLARR